MKNNIDKINKYEVLNDDSVSTNMIVIFMLFAVILIFTALPVQLLHGSEGRWAVIAKEMILTGDYLTPTINAKAYYDKPLLSYWLIIPFAWLNGAVTEWVARMPSAMGGLITVIITFLIASKLFGKVAGLISLCLISTDFLFIQWSQVASADILNTMGTWLVLLFFVYFTLEEKPKKYLFFMYIFAGLSCMLKGPVSAVVSFSAICFFTLGNTILELKQKDKITCPVIRKKIFKEISWLISPSAILGIVIGISFFALLLFLPVLLNADWGQARLMWKENVVRFLEPFDHKEPFYIYFKHSAIFFAPWTLIFIASLWDSRLWKASKDKRLILFILLGIFCFFSASGSRRSYYILPLVPAMAIISGYSLKRWLLGELKGNDVLLRFSILSTSFILFALPIAMFYPLLRKDIPHIPGLYITASVLIVLLTTALILYFKGKRVKCLTLIFIFVFIVELFFTSVGMAVAKKHQTFLPFCNNAVKLLENVKNKDIAIYKIEQSKFIFYLDRRGLPELKTIDDLNNFAETHPNGYVFLEFPEVDLKYLDKSIGGKKLPINSSVILQQKQRILGKQEEYYTLIKINPLIK